VKKAFHDLKGALGTSIEGEDALRGASGIIAGETIGE